MTALYKNLISLTVIFCSFFSVTGQKTIYNISSDTLAIDEILYERSVSFYITKIDSFNLVFEHFTIDKADTIPLFIKDFDLMDQNFDGLKKFNFNDETNFFEFTLGVFNHMRYLTILKLIQNGVITEEYTLE